MTSLVMNTLPSIEKLNQSTESIKSVLFFLTETFNFYKNANILILRNMEAIQGHWNGIPSKLSTITSLQFVKEVLDSIRILK